MRLGLLPATISPYVLRAIGPGATRALFTTGRRFDADEALRLGLVHDVVSEDGLEDARGRGRALVAGRPDPRPSPRASGWSARRRRHWTLDDLPERIALARTGAEGREGVTAFLERRSPSWSVDS